MKDTRPVFLDLTQMKFPCTAIASIAHRISGIILAIYLPFLLWMLQHSLASSQHFDTLKNFLNRPLSKLAIWILLVALLFHLFAGIRHLTMDMGIGDSYKSGRFSAYLVFVLVILLSLGAGIWLW